MTIALTLSIAILTVSSGHTHEIGVGRMQPIEQAPEWITLNPPRPGTPQARVAVRLKIGSPQSGGFLDPTYVVALPTGVAVVDKERSSVTLFDAAGTILATIGRRGAGPGDFSESLNQAVVMNNRLLVPDVKQRRLNIVDLVRRKWTESVGFPQVSEYPIWWVAAPPNDLLQLTMSSAPSGLALSITSWNGTAFRNVMSLPTPDAAKSPTWFGAMPMLASAPRPGTFALVSQSDGTVAVHSVSGQLVAGYKLSSGDAKPFTDIERNFFKGLIEPEANARQQKRIEQLLGRVPEASRSEARTMAKTMPALRGMAVPVGEHYPFFTDARFDSDEKLLWIARPLTAHEIQQSTLELSWQDLRGTAVTWDAYDLNGAFRMRATLPYGTIITDIGGSQFYGLQVDENGDRTVVVFAVAKR